jgi:general secretion pathway protein J
MMRLRGATGCPRSGGFTLVELLAVLVVLSLLALMSHRGLSAVLDARDHVRGEAGKWRELASFCARFERDLRLAAPRPGRTVTGVAPAWHGEPGGASGARLAFSRFAPLEGEDVARRISYQVNGGREIELWLWPGLDVAPAAQAERFPVLSGVRQFDLHYLNSELVWMDAWPDASGGPALPLAVRLRVALVTGEEIVRVFALHT